MTPRKGVVPARVRGKLKERSGGDRLGGFCEICGKPGNNAHHRKNQSQGGESVLSNLLLLCGSGTTGCHGWITEHPSAAKREFGWSVWRSDEPADVPVLYRDQWVRLDDEGHIHYIKKGNVLKVLGHIEIRRNDVT